MNQGMTKNEIVKVIKKNTSIIDLKYILRQIKKSWQLYVLIFLPLLYLVLFRYMPMVGAQIAFKDFSLADGIWGSPWVGLKHFNRFFNSYNFSKIIANTLLLSFYSLFAGFPFPIILAVSLNYCNNKVMKKTVQMVTYMPYFISTVVMVGIIFQFLAPRTGIINKVITAFGMDEVNFMGKAEYFRSIYVWSGIWQHTGYNSIIYLATLTGVDPTLYEAAIVDGANKWKRILYIDIPEIIPTAVILLIMNMGRILDFGFEKVLLMQTPLNTQTSEILATYVYKIGLESNAINFSYPSAIGLFVSVTGLFLIIISNWISRRVSESSLW